MAQIHMTPPRRSSSGKWILGCIIVAIVLAVASAVILPLLGVAFFGNLLGGIFGEMTELADTRPLPGDAARFDPLGALPEMVAYAGDGAKLVSITASQVRADGTTDLTATYSPAPYVNYEFAREVPRPADAPPVGAGGTTAGPWYEPIEIEAFQPGQSRQVTRTGGDVNLSYRYVNQGMVREAGTPSTAQVTFVPAPKCAFVDLWQAALERGAPRDAVAMITYDDEGYSFLISGAAVNLTFDMNCNLVE